VRRALMVLALSLMAPAGALAQGAVKSTHGPWELRCDTPPGARAEQCVVMQFVTAEDRENVGLTVIVLKTADGEARILRVLAPLGVLLPRGLGLRIDEEDLGSAGFVRCLPNGCVAEVIMDDALIEKLSAGQTATFIIFQTPEEGIGIPIALEGFRDAYAALPQPGAAPAGTGGAAAPAEAPAAGTDATPAPEAEPAPQ
jgi:invasion protein IalB